MKTNNIGNDAPYVVVTTDGQEVAVFYPDLEGDQALTRALDTARELSERWGELVCVLHNGIQVAD
jgi:hypothetical protein